MEVFRGEVKRTSVMGNFTVDSNISRSDDHIGLDETEDYYDLDTGNDTTLHNITLDYCDVSCNVEI